MKKTLPAVVALVIVLSLFFSLTHGRHTCEGAGLSAGCCSGSCRARKCYCDEVCQEKNDCCRDVPEHLNCNGPIRPLLFEAIKEVESHGNINAIGDGGKAIGPFQIHKDYWIDAVEYDSTLTSNGKTYQNCIGAGSIEYSMRVMQAYMRRYATEARLGNVPTDEDIARIHNGGLEGYRYSSTLGYWVKVHSCLYDNCSELN